MKYDYLVVGAGLYGSVFAHEVLQHNKPVIVVEKRNHIGGNIYTENINGINVHKYGAHIFHTNNEMVWDYMNQFASFNEYRHKVIADYKGKYYDLPFNMNTFHQLWGVKTAEEARSIIDRQRDVSKKGTNLASHCVSMVGTDVYNALVKGYTKKQWGRDPSMLPSSIIKRLPIRFEYNSDYFSDKYQGIPLGGYTPIIERLLDGIEVKLNYDFLQRRNEIEYGTLIYTGPIDEFFEYEFGHLEYRSLRFEEEIIDKAYYQKNSVINYTDESVPFTRIVEHKYFENNDSEKTVITREYPQEYSFKDNGSEPYYPVNDNKNNSLYKRYFELSKQYPNILFAGRLGEYKYYDMDEVVENALKMSQCVEEAVENTIGHDSQKYERL